MRSCPPAARLPLRGRPDELHNTGHRPVR
jgi:hypothetical protein